MWIKIIVWIKIILWIKIMWIKIIVWILNECLKLAFHFVSHAAILWRQEGSGGCRSLWSERQEAICNNQRGVEWNHVHEDGSGFHLSSSGNHIYCDDDDGDGGGDGGSVIVGYH